MANKNIFRRIEQKYLITIDEYNKIISLSEDKLCKDKFFSETICNIYFDNCNNDLIITSLEKPDYKEKIRLRSYGIPNSNSKVFLEIKKKYLGIVNKRRIILSLKEAYDYLENNKFPNDSQIMKEIDYAFKYYNLTPSLYLSYDRKSYYLKEDSEFRITFDTNIRSRTNDLKLESSQNGTLLMKDSYIMEIKSIKAIPLWFSSLLNSLKIYPTSFSKYGEIYKNKGDEQNV